MIGGIQNVVQGICIQNEYFIFHNFFLYEYILKGKVNRCPKGISLQNIFRNFLWKKKK